MERPTTSQRTGTTRGSGAKERAPKHNNAYAFVAHNTGKNIRIRKLPNEGVCPKCHEQIEWKKKMAKYKPLTVPAKCQTCCNKTVKAAYHAVCEPCAIKGVDGRSVCAKCRSVLEEDTREKSAKQVLEEKLMECTKERDRRRLHRWYENGTLMTNGKKPEAEGGDDDCDSDISGDEAAGAGAGASGHSTRMMSAQRAPPNPASVAAINKAEDVTRRLLKSNLNDDQGFDSSTQAR